MKLMGAVILKLERILSCFEVNRGIYNSIKIPCVGLTHCVVLLYTILIKDEKMNKKYKVKYIYVYIYVAWWYSLHNVVAKATS